MFLVLSCFVFNYLHSYIGFPSSSLYFNFFNAGFGANEMAYWEEALAAKPDKLNLNDPWTHTIKFQKLSRKLSSSLHTSVAVHAHARTKINQYIL